MALPLDTGTPFELVRTPFTESSTQLSPDGKWMAYQSDKSGRFEVYVQPFPPEEGAERVVSSGGGAQPRWNPNGRELFYIAFDEQLMAVPITVAADGRSIAPGSPAALFRTQIGGAIVGAAAHMYSVSRDGQRFLMATLADAPPAAPITLVLNWQRP